jgi:hypothetical protein
MGADFYHFSTVGAEVAAEGPGMATIEWDGPFRVEGLFPLYRCGSCGSMVDEWGLEKHAEFHDHLERIERAASAG